MFKITYPIKRMLKNCHICLTRRIAKILCLKVTLIIIKPFKKSTQSNHSVLGHCIKKLKCYPLKNVSYSKLPRNYRK